MPRLAVAVAVVAMAALVAAGFASSSNSTVDGAKPKSCPGLKKSPIVIADITDATGLPQAAFNQFPDAEGVAVQHINKDLCGLNGHPLRLTTCDSKFQPAAAAACANQVAAATPRAVAVVGASLNLTNNGGQTLHNQNLIVLDLPTTPADFADPDNFPVGGGGAAEMPAAGYFAATQLKVKKPALVFIDTPFGRIFASQVAGALTHQGLNTPPEVFFPNTVVDVSPYAAESANGGTDSIVTQAAGAALLKFYPLWAQLGIPADKVVGTSGAVDAQLLKSGGSAANGAYFVSEFKAPDDTKDPQVKEYRRAMARYGSSFSAESSFSEWGFSDVMTLYNAMKKIPGNTVNAATVSDYFHAAAAIPVFLGGVLRPKSAPPGEPALRNLSVTVVQWKNGKFSAVNGGKFFVAPTAGSQ